MAARPVPCNFPNVNQRWFARKKQTGFRAALFLESLSSCQTPRGIAWQNLFEVFSRDSP
jgi:hypothetical protein